MPKGEGGKTLVQEQLDAGNGRGERNRGWRSGGKVGSGEEGRGSAPQGRGDIEARSSAVGLARSSTLGAARLAKL